MRIQEGNHPKSKEELQELAALLEEKQRRQRYNKVAYSFPDEGPLRRDLYSKQVEFFKAGKNCRKRAIIAANRTGKSFAGAYEMTLHLTGLYPEWWTGKRFTHPVEAWAAGISNEETKDVIQHLMMGDFADMGSGMIPKDLIVGKPVSRPGVPEAVLTVRVKHHTDGTEDGISVLGFKSYEQKRISFQGTAKDVIWLDEEPNDYGIYTECLTRTMTTRGLIYCTFTPLLGLSDVVTSFMPGGKIPKDGKSGSDKFIIQCDWDDVPHISNDAKKEMLEEYTPYERDARSRGIPQLGSGAIYPILEEEVIIDSFPIPPEWPKVYGLDIGWKKTAAVWAAINPDTRQIFLYSEYYRGEVEPPVHAAGIQARGKWISGVIDPSSNMTSKIDGTRLLELYIDLGLDIIPADNSVETGILKVWQMLSSGQLKVFSNLQNWLSEFRIYRRDEKGKIVKKDDHLMDAMRYLVISGLDIATTEPNNEHEDEYWDSSELGGSDITGY